MLSAHGVGVAIAFNAEGTAPEWIMVMPLGADGVARTVDGRGPYKVADPKKLVSDTLAARDQLLIDENHATDLAAPNPPFRVAAAMVGILQTRSPLERRLRMIASFHRGHTRRWPAALVALLATGVVACSNTTAPTKAKSAQIAAQKKNCATKKTGSSAYFGPIGIRK